MTDAIRNTDLEAMAPNVMKALQTLFDYAGDFSSDAIIAALGYTPGNSRVLGPFVFNYNDAAFASTPFTKVFYTPTIGDILIDAWFSVVAAFDGTTPTADIGTFSGLSTGLFGYSIGPVLLINQDDEGAGAGLLVNGTKTGLVIASAYEGDRVAPISFTATNPLKVCISTNGSTGGSAVGGTVGIAHIYIVVAKPTLT